MTNEEKILEVLMQINGRLDKMDGRLDKMDGRLDRLETKQTEMQMVLEKVAVTQEGIVLPRLELLAEGHQTLRDTLAPLSRVDKLDEDVDLLKSTVKLLVHDVAELKRAQ